jgi:lysophospholipase L1-like esterase
LVALIAILELRLAALGQEGRVVSEDWQAENDAINRMNRAKVKSRPDDPLWRSDGIPVAEAKGEKRRILVLGDSFVWGDGYLNANEIWWRQLERELQRRGYGEVDVVAAGYPGASTQDQLDWLRGRKLLERVNPEVVILGYVTNDADVKGADGKYLVKQIGRDVPLPAWSKLDRVLRPVAPNLGVQLKQLLTRKWESKLTDAYNYNDWELKIIEGPSLEAYRAVVRELGDFLRTSRVPCIAVTLPNWPDRAYWDRRYQPIRPVFSQAGVRLHDLLGPFVREHPPGGEVLQWGVNPANGHPSPVATRFYAREVADILERDHAQALGQRGPTPRNSPPRINDWMPPSANVRQRGPDEWELSYPAQGELTPRLPLGKPHVVLAFAQPVAIKNLRVSGTGLNEAELFLTSVDPHTGIERKQHTALGSRPGTDASWSLLGIPEATQVNTLKLAARIEARGSAERTLRVRIEFDEKPVRP